MTIAEADIAHWRTWIGMAETRSERLDVEALRRFAAATGEPLDVEQVQPPLAHWAFFLPVAGADQIGADGHPKRGGFLPPVNLPRRMFAAAQMDFGDPLSLGDVAHRHSTVLDVTHKSGRSGDLVLVDVEHRIEQGGAERVTERQTILYRDIGEAMSAFAPKDIAAAEGDAAWQPGPVDLFRFSAVTFNSHRIHYDLSYATHEEGYPGLVVHGPFTATRLFSHARVHRGPPRAFGFRAAAPIFCGQPVVLRTIAEGDYRAVRCDGTEAMVATVQF
jgi:3-methylfumaryl-CoA hydratase